MKNNIESKKEISMSYDRITKQLEEGTYKGEKIGGTEYSNRYAGEDGSTIEVYYENPIRYRDKNGKLKEYDSQLISTENRKAVAYGGNADSDSYDEESYAFENKSGDSKQYFPEKLNDETPILMEKDNYSLSFSPKETDTLNVELKEGNAEYKSDDENITYQYESLDNGVKENIIFSDVPEEKEYSFSYTLDGMYMKADEKTNTVALYDKKTGTQVAVLQTPYLNDNTKNNYSYDIKTKVSNEKNEWTVTYTLPEKYLKSSDTSYPVTLDPTVAWITENNPNEPIGISYVIELPEAGEYVQYVNAVNRFTIGRSGAGDYYKTYVKFKNLNEQLKGKIVSYASMNVNVAQQVGGAMNVDMHEVKGDWSLESLVWATQPEVSENVMSQSQVGLEDKSYGIDFTRYCNMVAKGQADASKGVELRTEQKSKYMEFWGIKKKGKAPLFIMSYASAPESMKATYDGSFNLTGEYDEDKKAISISWDSYLDIEGGPGRSYMVCKRVNDSFEPIGYTYETSYQVPVDDIDSVADIRVVARDNQGTNATEEDDVNVLSNIITFKKNEITKDQDEGDTEAVSYEQTTVDTDGDGLEDGYEIWDFKTMWNTETADSTEENPKYEQDTDGDGLPDGYEVFTLGTDPAVANGENADSDGDGWTDLKEYQKGTDPWLYDSDFDGLRDKDDVGDNNPRKTDNPRLKGTDRSVASAAKVHKGLYDREYSENENGVTVTYIANIYRGDIKSIYSDYGDAKINKRLKYFYDAKGNNTAIVEQYDDNDTQTICITYTYDENGNVEFICDQQTKYTMEYNSDNKITNFQVGDRTLVSYEYSHTQNDSGNESGESTGALVENTDEQITYYGTGDDRQKVRTVTTEYKDNLEDDAAVAEKTEVFYNDEKTPSYVTTVNSSGQMLNLTDNTENTQLAYNYEYNDNTTRVTRSDGFIKEVVQNEDEENKKSTLTTKYEYKALDDKKETLISKIETDSSDGDKIKNRTTLYNGDVLSETMSDDGKSCVTNLYSDKYKKNILKYNSVEDDSTHRTFNIEKYGENKNIDYTYDRAGNITKIKTDGKLTNAYEYDAHGRLTWEYDYDVSRAYEYGYTTTGNVEAKHTYVINDNGKLVEQDDELRKYSYRNGDWPDQLTKYCGKEITYDSSGNPKEYYNGMSFNWYRGRQLQEATLANGNRVTYKYNEDGLRIYKDTEKTTTTYEWDETKLIRENVTYKKTGKKYDIWYMYDSGNNVIGFEYSQLSEINETLKTTRIYYEKNLQGDVTGLLDEEGAEIASYTYDAWGNVITDNEKSFCYEGYEVPFELNHVLYRGYYYDGSYTDTESDTNLYYLQSRYYDSEVGRFINADDVSVLGIKDISIYKDNLYCYCNSNPVNAIDPTGKLASEIYLAYEFIKACVALVSAVILYCNREKIARSFINFCKSVGNGMAGIANTVVHGGAKVWGWSKTKIKNAISAVKAFTAVAKADATIRSRVRRSSKTRYWSATLRRGYVDIGRSLTYSQAVKEVSYGRNVFTVTKTEALAVAKAAGKNKKPVGPEIDRGKSGIMGYYWHFHTYNRNGAHVWYLF